MASSRETTPSPTSPLPGVIEPEFIDIAIDTNYLETSSTYSSTTTSSSPSSPSLPATPFPFDLLPAEIQIMVLDSLVHSAISTARINRASIKSRLFNSSNHEAWLTTIATLKNVVACDLDLAAQIFDSLSRLQSELPGESAEHDDCLSELLYVARLQLCESHAQEMLQADPRGLNIFRRRPVLEKDLWRLTPGPVGTEREAEAWGRLFGEELKV